MQKLPKLAYALKTIQLNHHTFTTPWDKPLRLAWMILFMDPVNLCFTRSLSSEPQMIIHKLIFPCCLGLTKATKCYISGRIEFYQVENDAKENLCALPSFCQIRELGFPGCSVHFSGLEVCFSEFGVQQIAA